MQLLSMRDYDIDTKKGFLPTKSPIQRLPNYFAPWEAICDHLPKLLVANRVRSVIDQLPQLDIDKLHNIDHIKRAMLLLSYMGHAYVWGNPLITDTLPACIAVPWYHVAQTLGRPPVLSYASHALYNWGLFDPEGEINLENLYRLQNFYGGLDEDWFVLIHIAIEAQAAPAIQSCIDAIQAVHDQAIETVVNALDKLSNTLHTLVNILSRMAEKCDPYIYYNRVRTFIFGWMKNPALPNGVFYHSVKEWQGKGQYFRGETGAQSSIIPSIDACLGLKFNQDTPLHKHLMSLRDYMPPKHRQFIEKIEQLEKVYSVRQFVSSHHNYKKLVNAYNACLDEISEFRKIHFNYAMTFINKQSEKYGSPVGTGTGGTPLVKYLGNHIEEIVASKITQSIARAEVVI